MGRIIAIGGGELRNGDTFEIDKMIVQAAEKKSPKFLFIPTASNDAEGYIETMVSIYGGKLGCEVSALKLHENPPTKEEIRSMILGADIIYVGGGNTKKMMAIWKELSVDEYLKEAYEKGIVLSGLSAGSICWFKAGHSDSDTLENGEIKPYSMVSGLGLIPMFHCPHFNEEGRADDFVKKVQTTGMTGLALENNTAIDLHNNTYRIIKTDKYAYAYKLELVDGKVEVKKLEESNHYLSTSDLLG